MEKTKAEAALQQLESLIQGRVRSRLRGWPADRLDDVLQEVRMKLWEVFSSGKEIEKPAAYGQRLIDNAINDALRATMRNRRQFVVLDHEFVADDDPAAEVAAADMKLTDGQRELLGILKEVGTSAGVAERLGITKKSAWERVSRLHRELKAQAA